MRTLPYTPPGWLTYVNASLFVVMSSVSIIPNTIFLRNFSLITGALIGVYLIYRNRNVFSLRNSFPLISLTLFFIWVLVHYAFFAGDPHMQLHELSSVWKRVFLSFLFAVGLGLSINVANRVNLLLVIVGFAASFIIFYVRWLIDFLGLAGISPFFTLNYYEPSTVGYIPKYYLTTFIIPWVALCFSIVIESLNSPGRYKIIHIAGLALILLGSLNIFYIVGNKNATLFFLIIFFSFTIYLLLKSNNKISLRKYLVVGFLAACFFPIIYSHIKSEPTWTNFIVDSRATLDFEKNDQWKYSGGRGVPVNELGKPVNGSAYLRLAWAIKGLDLLLKNPMGYGLLVNSFGPLAKSELPDSSFTHTHSGWLDIALAFGIPGLLLILLALFGAAVRCSKKFAFIPKAGTWVLLSMALVFISAEVAERILFDYLIFLIAFFAASTINAD